MPQPNVKEVYLDKEELTEKLIEHYSPYVTKMKRMMKKEQHIKE